MLYYYQYILKGRWKVTCISVYIFGTYIQYKQEPNICPGLTDPTWMRLCSQIYSSLNSSRQRTVVTPLDGGHSCDSWAECGVPEVRGECRVPEVRGQCRVPEVRGECMVPEVRGQCRVPEVQGAQLTYPFISQRIYKLSITTMPIAVGLYHYIPLHA